MTASRITQVALAQFAHHGYEATSLAMIADEVGIKKPSIYAHFKSKQDLFLHVLQTVFQHELIRVNTFFKEHRGQSLEWQLRTFLYEHISRYEQQLDLKFMIRVTFVPPAAMETAVLDQVYAFLDQLEKDLMPVIAGALRNSEIASIHPEQAATAFMCLLDGLYAELLYGGNDRCLRKLEASWNVYWRGLTLRI